MDWSPKQAASLIRWHPPVTKSRRFAYLQASIKQAKNDLFPHFLSHLKQKMPSKPFVISLNNPNIHLSAFKNLCTSLPFSVLTCAYTSMWYALHPRGGKRQEVKFLGNDDVVLLLLYLTPALCSEEISVITSTGSGQANTTQT